MIPLSPVVRYILIACGAVFLLQQISTWPDARFALWPLQSIRFEAWQLVSYGFLHGDLMHLLFNMLALYSFGSDIERLYGAKRFTIYYLVCVVAAAVAQLIVQQATDGLYGRTVGASGGVFGVLLAFGMAFPHRKLVVFPLPIPMPAWVLVALYGLIELYLGVSGRAPGVAHFAHLGGMLGGLPLILYWRNQQRQRFRR
jgi:membrane associated rhomboid family serine protease